MHCPGAARHRAAVALRLRPRRSRTARDRPDSHRLAGVRLAFRRLAGVRLASRRLAAARLAAARPDAVRPPRPCAAGHPAAAPAAVVASARGRRAVGRPGPKRLASARLMSLAVARAVAGTPTAVRRGHPAAVNRAAAAWPVAVYHHVRVPTVRAHPPASARRPDAVCWAACSAAGAHRHPPPGRCRQGAGPGWRRSARRPGSARRASARSRRRRCGRHPLSRRGRCPQVRYRRRLRRRRPHPTTTGRYHSVPCRVRGWPRSRRRLRCPPASRIAAKVNSRRRRQALRPSSPLRLRSRFRHPHPGPAVPRRPHCSASGRFRCCLGRYRRALPRQCFRRSGSPLREARPWGCWLWASRRWGSWGWASRRWGSRSPVCLLWGIRPWVSLLWEIRPWVSLPWVS